MSKAESKFQAELISEIESRFPGCIVLKNDAGYKQGIPDLTILHGKRWATLEVKKSKDASHRPNQDYYVDRMNEMSFSRFVYPENKQEVLDDLERALRTCRKTRLYGGVESSLAGLRREQIG